MQELLDIYCLSKIVGDVGEYRKDDYLSNDEAVELKYLLREKNAKIVPNVIALVDVIASPDYVLNSSLGMKDRSSLYQRYINDVRSAKRFIGKPKHWRQLFDRPVKPHPKI